MRCPECGHEQSTGRFCGHCGGLVRSEEPPEPADRRSWLQGRRRPWVLAAAATFLVGAFVVAGVTRPAAGPAPPSGEVALPDGGTAALPDDGAMQPVPAPTRRATPTPGPSGPLFAGSTDTVLLFDDGTDGIVALDLDTGARSALDLDGQRAGDQPYRLWRSGVQLVVGWGEIHAEVPGSGRPPREVGDATIFVPDAHPDRVWLVSWSSGRVGQGTMAWENVGVDGTVYHRGEHEGGLMPVRGVPGGLALRDDAGRLVEFDVDTGTLVDGVGDRDTRIGDVSAGQVAWCDAPCRRLVVARPGGDVVLGGPDVEAFLDHPGSVRLSDDGRYVLTHVRVLVDGGQAVDLQLQVHDLQAEELVDATSVPLGQVHSDWTGDGGQLFASVQFQGATSAGAPHELLRWTATQGFEVVDLGPYGVPPRTFVTYPVEAAGWW